MTSEGQDRSTRFVRWWARRYTAGLIPDQVARRRAEIDSDLAEHRHWRDSQGWTRRLIARERVTRLLRGVAADVEWRHDLLRARNGRHLHAALTSVTGLATLLLATFHFAFAIYLLGGTALANQPFLGGLVGYGEEGPIGSAVAATIIGSLGLVLLIAVLARPISPLVANVAVTSIAMISVMFFWLGIWPIGLIAMAGSVTDFAIRTPHMPPP
jgi:hypothetical protein